MARMIFISLALLALAAGCGNELTVMTFNVENLFDDRDDGLEYPEFRVSHGKWNTRLFREKLKAVAGLIKEAVPCGPDIVALQEVENANALSELNEGYLKDLDYRYEILVPSPLSPIQVAFLSRYPVTYVRTHAVCAGEYENRMRFILEMGVEFRGETLVLFNNHWKSRLDGPGETEFSRRLALRLLTACAAGCLKNAPGSRLVVAGDFNQDGVALETGAGSFYDPWSEMEPSKRGSYLFRGKLQAFDHFLLSPGFFTGLSGLAYEKGGFRLIAPAPGGPAPSDHSALLLTLQYR
jgi:hypothetical protein